MPEQTVDTKALWAQVYNLRQQLSTKKAQISKTTNLPALVVLQAEAKALKAQIDGLVAQLPTGFAFRDAVDRHMVQGCGR
jgi:hypothetical protein